MTIRRLALAVLVLAIAGATVVAALGARALVVVGESRTATEAALELRHRLRALDAAIDYAVLIDADPVLLAGIGADARGLARDAATLAHPGARPFERYLVEVANVTDELDRALREAPDVGTALRELAEFQLRIHTAGANASLDALLDELANTSMQVLGAAYRVTVAVAIGFALIAGAAALGVYGRLERGLRPLERSVRRIARGDLSVRVAPRGRDELAQLGEAFDGMAERLERGAAALREREARFRMIAELTADTVWEIDVEHERAWWHDGASSLLGPEPSEGGVALEVLEARAPDHVGSALRALADAEADDVLRGLEHDLTRPDGTVATVVTSARLVRDADGRPVRVLGATRDVTMERTVDARLERAERLEALGHLTGGVAHDFNNLLTVILGNAEALAERDEADPRQRAAATLILDAAQRGADLTRRLLTFARERPTTPRRVDLGAAVGRSAELLRRSVGESIEVQLHLPHHPERALLDPTQFESALLNLALNARDAMPRGGTLRIAVATRELDEADGVERPGRFVCVDVEDEGYGIAQEHMPHLFEPFFTTKGPGKGTGLGLPMVYGMVTQAHGFVLVDSRVDQGTRFTLAFPVAPAGSDEEEPSLAPAAPARSVVDATVLVVEDDPLVRDSVVAAVAALGYRTLVASRASEALELLRDHPEIDLLFTDVVMPGGMDGGALAVAARQRRPGLPVVLTSGYTMGVDVDLPDTRMLRKPYRPHELAEVLADALSAGPVHDARGPRA